jgi:hypothetical protein
VPGRIIRLTPSRRAARELHRGLDQGLKVGVNVVVWPGAWPGGEPWGWLSGSTKKCCNETVTTSALRTEPAADGEAYVFGRALKRL